MGDPLCTCSGSIGPNGSTFTRCARCQAGGYEWRLVPKRSPFAALSAPPSEEWTADSARGHDGSIGVYLKGDRLAIYVDVLPDGKVLVYVGGNGSLQPPLKLKMHLPAPPPFDYDEITDKGI